MEKLGGLKDAPLWFLGAISVTALALWHVAALHVLVPTEFQKFLPLTTILFWVLFAAQGINRIVTTRSARLVARRAQQRQQLEKVYRPMVSVFNNCHVTAVSVSLAPNLRHRIKEAARVWSGRWRWRGKFKGVWRALRDRQETTSAEMEYGGDFPLDKILAIAKANSEHVDSTLRNLIRLADRSRYEDEPPQGTLTAAEYALLNHLGAEEIRLAKLVAL